MFYIDNADEIIPIHRQYSYILFADSRHTTPHTRVEYFGSILFIYFVCANEFDIGLAFANFNCEGADVLVHRVVFWFRGVRRKIFVLFFSLIFSVIFFFACEIFVLFYLIDSRMFRAVINRVACQSVKPIRWTKPIRMATVVVVTWCGQRHGAQCVQASRVQRRGWLRVEFTV